MRLNSNINDKDAISKIREGDYFAFKWLYEKYYQILFNFSLKIVNESYLADDIVQEVFIKLWEKRRTLRINAEPKAYLFSAVKNTSLNYLKSNKIRLEHINLHVSQKSNSVTQDEIELEEFRNILMDCINKLPARCKEVFVESRFTDHKQDEIADSLKITVKTVKAQIGKALKLIKECLSLVYPEYL